MARNITKAELVGSIADQTGLSRRQVADVLDALGEDVAKAIREVKSVTIPGVARISCTLRKARNGRNPATGESIRIAAKVGVRAKVPKSVVDNNVPSVDIARRKLRA